jgi:hypothetical protein
MAAHGTGLHHVARFVDDYDGAVAGYAERGMEPYFGGRGMTEKQRFCYFDPASIPLPPGLLPLNSLVKRMGICSPWCLRV